jgi:membrane complex biogenesis BtpA family protein
MKISVAPPKQSALEVLFPTKKPILGVIHLPPLPGAPRYKGGSLQEVIDIAMHDLEIMVAEGVDGIMTENAGDVPFLKGDEAGYETAAALAVVTHEVRKATTLPVGVACLANGVLSALAVAKAASAHFIRPAQWVLAYIEGAGFIEGPAGKALRYRSAIKADDIKIFTDVHIQHGSHAIVGDRPVTEQARDAEFFDADVLIATGFRAGSVTPVKEIKAMKAASTLPVLVGSGVNPDNVAELFQHADGAIVGSYFRRNGVWWEAMTSERVARLMDKVREVRTTLQD